MRFKDIYVCLTGWWDAPTRSPFVIHSRALWDLYTIEKQTSKETEHRVRVAAGISPFFSDQAFSVRNPNCNLSKKGNLMNREHNWRQLLDVWTYYVIRLCCYQNNQSCVIWPPPKLPQEALSFQPKFSRSLGSLLDPTFSLHMQSSNRLRPEVLAETGSWCFLLWWGSESSWTLSSGSCDECLHLPCNYLPF